MSYSINMNNYWFNEAIKIACRRRSRPISYMVTDIRHANNYIKRNPNTVLNIARSSNINIVNASRELLWLQLWSFSIVTDTISDSNRKLIDYESSERNFDANWIILPGAYIIEFDPNYTLRNLPDAQKYNLWNHGKYHTSL